MKIMKFEDIQPSIPSSVHESALYQLCQVGMTLVARGWLDCV